MTAERLAWPLGWTHEPEEDFFVDRDRQFQRDLNVVRFPGDLSDRFELRRGDIGANDGQRKPRYERSEKSELGDRKRRGEEVWYGWSFKVPMDFPEANEVDSTSNQVTLAQFQQEPPNIADAKPEDWKPAWMFGKRICGPFCVRLFPTIDKAQATWWSLIEHDKFRGAWHDIVVHAKWCSTSEGVFRIWVNGVMKMAFFGKNCSAHDGRIYHKYGIYRAHHPSNQTAVAYFSQLRKSTVEAEVRVSVS